ncbi:hypothetical protein AAMO2058_001718600 [Amorphochlora amoebiformis]|uniref:Uncharacterized protein n=1 Tax=Amorphochlora amoebiformis TaxID=1561963 RepID=A0A7S0D312_9EUKA|mmetsp:Transcript_1821/g.2504  ORF Transcript_1821/g.2504 Transcript_1821/m.2504 type:complete len:169 (+) Transcript_1821:71-577(+)
MPLALAVTVLSQALLISWAAMRPVLGVSYIFSNFAMVFLGIHLLANSSSHQAYAIFIIFFTFTIFHDVLCWLAYFPEVSQMKQFEAIDILSFTVAIASTLLKPCQSVLLCRQFSKQGLDMSWSSLDHMFRLDSVRANNGLEGKEYNPINAGEEYNPIHDHKKFSTMPP